MSQNACEYAKFQEALSAARYLRSAVGELAKLARQAQLDHVEAMLLAAKIEAQQAVILLSLKAAGKGAHESGAPKILSDQSWLASKETVTRPPGDEAA